MDKTQAYTTPRPDVFAMVPESAMGILDVGCSNGALGASLRQARPGRYVAGIEFDPGFAQEAAQRLDKVLAADLNALALEDAFHGEMFDCIVFADVLEHLLNPEKVLMSAASILKETGSLVISMPNIRHISALYSIAVQGRFPKRDRGIFDKTHLRWFTLADARMLLDQAGFSVQAESYALRVGDKGGGFHNRLATRFLAPIAGFYPVREFLTYQYCILAVKKP